MIYRRWSRWSLFLIIAALFLPLMLALGVLGRAAAQGTPLPMIIPTLTPTTVRQITMTPTRTAAPAGPGQGRAEAKDVNTGADIRAAPSTEAEKLGNIRPGQFYAIVQRYEKWLQIQYDKSASGLGWVYMDLVNVTGIPVDAIPTATQGAVPSPNVATAAAQQTANYLTQTPGAPQTATVLQSSATGVFTRVAVSDGAAGTPGEALPTFTFPPPFVEATLPARGAASSRQTGRRPLV